MMPAGRYYVGDLGYVMHPQWDDFCALSFRSEVEDGGEVTMPNGVQVAFQSTMYGDGTYVDQFGNSYAVDAGLIGCILVQDITDPNPHMAGGQIMEFCAPFETSYNNGVIRIGHLSINTADDDDAEEDDYQDDNDDD